MADNERIEFTIEGKDKASGVFGSAGKALGLLGAAAVATVAGFTALIKSSANAQEEIGDLNKITRLGVETISELSHIAVITNTSVEGLANGFKFMSKSASDVASGGAEASEAYRLLGVSVRDAEGQMKPSVQLMGELSDSLNRVSDPIERTNLGLRIFGRAWQDVAKATSDGSAAMRRLAEDARYLGVAMNAQGVANASAFNDQVDRIGQAIKGASMSIANEWIPILTGFARATANAIADSREALKNFSKAALDGVLFAFAAIEITVTKVFEKIKYWFSSAEGFDDFIENAKRAFSFLFDVAAKALQSIGVLMVGAFKLAWESFVEVGKWAWQKVFDFFTGQDLAGTLGETLFERIPEATRETRDELKGIFGEMKAEWVDTFVQAGDGISEVFGITMEGIQARVDEIKNKFTELGEVQKETNIKSVEDERITAVRKLEAQLAYLQQKQAMIDASLMTESEQYALADQMNSIRLQLAQERDYLTRDEYKKKTELLELQKQARLGNIQAQAELLRRQVSEMNWQAQLQFTSDSLSSISQLMSTENEKQFRIGKAASIAQAVINTYTAAINAYQSASAIPIVGWVLGPIAAAAAVAFGMAQVSKIRSQQFGGQAHAGLTNVPYEGTFLLNKGERVIAPEQNRDLTNFLANGGSGGGGVYIEKLEFHLLENATSFESLMNLSERQLQELIAGKLYPTIAVLDRRGIRPSFVERYNR